MSDFEKGIAADIHNTSLYEFPDRISKGGVLPELEMGLPEETIAQVEKKIDAETDQARKLTQEADKEYPGTKVYTDADKNPETPKDLIDEHGIYDYRLRQKAAKLDTDISRLVAKHQQLVDNNIQTLKDRQKDEGLKSYAISISKETRTVANYLRSIKRVRRGKRAGKKGGEPFTKS